MDGWASQSLFCGFLDVLRSVTNMSMHEFVHFRNTFHKLEKLNLLSYLGRSSISGNTVSLDVAKRLHKALLNLREEDDSILVLYLTVSSIGAWLMYYIIVEALLPFSLLLPSLSDSVTVTSRQVKKCF